MTERMPVLGVSGVSPLRFEWCVPCLCPLLLSEMALGHGGTPGTQTPGTQTPGTNQQPHR